MSLVNQVPGQLFPHWENNQEKEAQKLAETKKEIEKIEFKGKQKILKKLEVRSFLIKRRVTQGYEDRKKIKPFGIGHNEDEVRQNINLTSIQRENVWHPYYEIKVEEEDFKEKIQAKQREKKEKAANQDIDELESKIKALEEKERQEAMAQSDGTADKKKTYNYQERI